MDFSFIGSIFTKFRDAIMWIAEEISSKLDVAPSNIYYLILLALSVFFATKLFFKFFTSLEKRWVIFFIIVGIIFGILAFFKL